jgi:hypothetical protein
MQEKSDVVTMATGEDTCGRRLGDNAERKVRPDCGKLIGQSKESWNLPMTYGIVLRACTLSHIACLNPALDTGNFAYLRSPDSLKIEFMCMKGSKKCRQGINAYDFYPFNHSSDAH